MNRVLFVRIKMNSEHNTQLHRKQNHFYFDDDTQLVFIGSSVWREIVFLPKQFRVKGR